MVHAVVSLLAQKPAVVLVSEEHGYRYDQANSRRDVSDRTHHASTPSEDGTGQYGHGVQEVTAAPSAQSRGKSGKEASHEEVRRVIRSILQVGDVGTGLPVERAAKPILRYTAAEDDVRGGPIGSENPVDPTEYLMGLYLDYKSAQRAASEEAGAGGDGGREGEGGGERSVDVDYVEASGVAPLNGDDAAIAAAERRRRVESLIEGRATDGSVAEMLRMEPDSIINDLRLAVMHARTTAENDAHFTGAWERAVHVNATNKPTRREPGVGVRRRVQYMGYDLEKDRRAHRMREDFLFVPHPVSTLQVRDTTRLEGGLYVMNSKMIHAMRIRMREQEARITIPALERVREKGIVLEHEDEGKRLVRNVRCRSCVTILLSRERISCCCFVLVGG